MAKGRTEQIEIQQQPAVSDPGAACASIERNGDTPAITASGKIRTGRLAGLSMWQAIWVLTWPVLVESTLASLVGLADTVLAAGISEPATDAIGGTAYFMWFINLIGMALGIGATAMVSRSVGKGRLAVANAAVGQAIYLGIGAGLGVGVLIAVLAPWIADWFGLVGEANSLAVMYLSITALAVPLQTILNIGIACHRGAGDSFRPLLLMGVVNVVNISASFVLSGVDIGVARKSESGELVRHVLVENPFGFDLGLSGIAAGTCLAWSLGGVLMLLMLGRGTHGVRLMAKRLSPHRHTMRRLVKVSIPNFLETLGLWFGNILVIWMIGQVALPGVLGAHIVAVRIEAWSFMPGFAVSLAAATLAGQYLGAGSPTCARRAILRCAAIGTGIMTMFGVLFVFVPLRITGIFTQLPTHLELVPEILMICGFIQIPFALAIVLRSAMRGAGDTTVVMWITWTTTFGIRLPLVWLFCGVEVPLPGGYVLPNPAPLQEHWDIHPLVGTWIGLSAEIALRGLVFTVYFMTGRWAKAKV